MLGFGPLATLPLAGSPLGGGAAVAYVFALEGGTYTLEGGDASITKTNVLSALGGTYTIESPDTVVARNRTYDLEGGVYAMTGFEARVFTSSFFYGDPEVFRVTPEVTAMRVLPEHRDMVTAYQPTESVATSEQDDAAVPRLRRT